jgi:hypothetical protein
MMENKRKQAAVQTPAPQLDAVMRLLRRIEMIIIIRIVIAIILFGHAIGHVVGFLGSWTKSQLGLPDFAFNNSPWVLPGEVVMQSSVGKVFGIFWLLSMGGFSVAAIGLLAKQSWWPPIAIIASFLSLAAVIPWWNSITPGIMSKESAVLVDILVLIALLCPWREVLIARLSSG